MLLATSWNRPGRAATSCWWKTTRAGPTRRPKSCAAQVTKCHWRRTTGKALEILESSQPVDLLLTDIVMPKRINGVALGRMARMRRGTLPLLYMTAYDIPGLAAETESTVLIKPISEVELIGAVERALAG